MGKRICRECGTGPLTIIDAHDCGMTVECGGCGSAYDVEPDAFEPDCMDWAEAMVDQELAEKQGREAQNRAIVEFVLGRIYDMSREELRGFVRKEVLRADSDWYEWSEAMELEEIHKNSK